MMKEHDRILALIPARSGSKGIKNKNIVSLCRKPLISYTIEAAKKCSAIDDVIVTTDSEEIAGIAREYGAETPFLRPKALASDRAKTIDAVLHAIGQLKDNGRIYDVLVLLQPTSPLRTYRDIEQAVNEFYKHGRKGLLSVSPVRDSPVLIRSMNDESELTPLILGTSTVRRQDMKPYVAVNGSIYINLTADIDETLSFNDNPIGFLMEEEHSVDIDSGKDLELAKRLLTIKDGELPI